MNVLKNVLIIHLKINQFKLVLNVLKNVKHALVKPLKTALLVKLDIISIVIPVKLVILLVKLVLVQRTIIVYLVLKNSPYF